MRVHHLNTGTMCPLSPRLSTGRGSLFGRARLVCHVLLVETPRDGLVLVDTGLGTGDIADPDRLGRRWLRLTAPRLDPDETALARVRALGHDPADVRHVALTHLDLDHAGGVPDFPRAQVHVHRREQEAALSRAGRRAAYRYIPGHWSHGPDWRPFDDGGETWFGFEGVRSLLGDPDLLAIPLPGHTPGHTAYAVRTGGRWRVHAGDAYFFHGQIETPSHAPLAQRWFQRKVDTDRALRRANQERLRVLRAEHADQVTIFNGHDPVDLDRATAAEGGPEAQPKALGDDAVPATASLRATTADEGGPEAQPKALGDDAVPATASLRATTDDEGGPEAQPKALGDDAAPATASLRAKADEPRGRLAACSAASPT